MEAKSLIVYLTKHKTESTLTEKNIIALENELKRESVKFDDIRDMMKIMEN